MLRGARVAGLARRQTGPKYGNGRLARLVTTSVRNFAQSYLRSAAGRTQNGE